MLRLESISKESGGVTHLHSLDLALQPRTINVLLGATLAGKTTLLRIMAGLDQPTRGRVFAGERDVTGVSVRQRNLAMVYQQFINYPSLTVYENIASPLRIQRRSAAEIRGRVGEIAEALHLSPYLDRLPAELSGGQQQRTALARALAKQAELLLLDEPLVNLDYKLREELRNELAQLFERQQMTVVYATTEPQEALLLGGHTAVLHEGRLLQYGKTHEVFTRPASIEAAKAFSDPPINLFRPAERMRLPQEARAVGVRPHHLRTHERNGDTRIQGIVELAEISGSDTYLHLANEEGSWVAQLRGIHDFSIGGHCDLYFSMRDAFGFDATGRLLFAPEPM